MAEWLQSKIVRFSELNNVEEKHNILSDIKIKLGSLNNREAEQISRNVDFSLLIAQLTSNDREFVDQVCDILKALFGVLEPGEVYQKYSREISQLIIHPADVVRSLVLHEIFCTVSNPQKLFLLLRDVNLLVAVINRVGDDNLVVANCAMRILKVVGKNPYGLQILYTGEPYRSLARLLINTDTISFRIYEVVVEIAKSSKEGLEASIQTEFLNGLVDVLENKDMLLQINALEILTELAITEEGLNYLAQQQIIRKFVQRITMTDENPLSNLLIPGLMKFFGNIARYWPNEIFSKYPIVISALFEIIDSGDQTMLGVGLDTLGHVSTRVKGKYALHALGDAMPNALKKIADIIQSMPTALRIRGLNNLALILNVQKAEQDDRILSLTKSWFNSMCDDPMGMILALCRQPFADIRQASLEVMAVVASQEWGQEYISSYPGLVEFLLDRNVESFKECKEAKYAVVKELAEAEQDVFDANMMQRFAEFVSQGPYYVETDTDVAVEGGL